MKIAARIQWEVKVCTLEWSVRGGVRSWRSASKPLNMFNHPPYPSGSVADP